MGPCYLVILIYLWKKMNYKSMSTRFINLLRKHYLFVIPYLIFLVFAFFVEISFSKADLFLLTNKYHSPFFDHFFMVITWLGDGKTVVLVGLSLCMVKYRYSVLTFFAFGYTSIITYVLKVLFNAPRPCVFFEGKCEIRTVPGLETHSWNSFPSGHSASAFTLSVVLMHILPHKYRGFILFPLALIIIFSRVYLAQHFFQDVVAGSILGTFLTLQMIWWLENTEWYRSPKLDGKLF